MKAVYLCALMDMTNWDLFFSLPSDHFAPLYCFFSFFNSKHAGNVQKGSSLSFI